MSSRQELQSRLTKLDRSTHEMRRLYPDFGDFISEFVSHADHITGAATQADLHWTYEQVEALLNKHGRRVGERKLVVLVVEDQQRNRSALVEIVKSWENVSLVTCDSFDSAVIWLSSGHHLDLVICDYRLNGEDTGTDLADIAAITFPRIAVVIVSSHALSKNDGLTDRYTFLRKPFGVQDLARHIEQSFTHFKITIRK